MKTGFVEEMLADMQSGIYDFTVDGKCSDCGNCCSDFLPISEKEIKAIRRYIRQNNIKEQKHIVPTAQVSMDWTCPFRDNTNKRCVIYPVRPAICRDFKCDKPKQQIWADRDMYHDVNRVVLMRQEFFGGKT